MSPFESESILLGGDLNVYLNPILDKLYVMSIKEHNPIYKKDILSLKIQIRK